MNLPDVLKRPLVIGLLALVLGLLIGLTWGWVIQPVELRDATAYLLHPSLQDQYLRMAIDSYMVNGDEELASKRYQDLGDKGPTIFENIKANPGKQDPAFIDRYRDMLQRRKLYTPGQPPVTTPSSGGGSSSLVSM